MSFLFVPESGKDNKTQISISKIVWYIPVDFQGISTNSIHKMFNLITENYTNNFNTRTHTKKNKQTKYQCLFRSCRFEAVVLVSGTKIVGRIFRFDRSTLPPSWDVERWRLVDFFLKKTNPKKAI